MWWLLGGCIFFTGYLASYYAARVEAKNYHTMYMHHQGDLWGIFLFGWFGYFYCWFSEPENMRMAHGLRWQTGRVSQKFFGISE